MRAGLTDVCQPIDCGGFFFAFPSTALQTFVQIWVTSVTELRQICASNNPPPPLHHHHHYWKWRDVSSTDSNQPSFVVGFHIRCAKLLNTCGNDSCRAGETDAVPLMNVAGGPADDRGLDLGGISCFLAGTTLTLEVKRCQLDRFKSTSHTAYPSFSEANGSCHLHNRATHCIDGKGRSFFLFFLKWM